MATGDKFSLGRLDGKVALITGYNRNIFFKGTCSYWWASRLLSCQNLTLYQSMLYAFCILFVSIFRTVLVFKILSMCSPLHLHVHLWYTPRGAILRKGSSYEYGYSEMKKSTKK